VKRFRRGLVLQAHRLVYRSTLGLRVIKKKRKEKFQGLERCALPVLFAESSAACSIQGYLAHKKTPSPRSLQLGYAFGPTAVLGGVAVSYERGTPVLIWG